MNIFSENVSVNITKTMRNKLETIGSYEEKKISSVIRELLLKGIREKTIDCKELNDD
ncbi:MAG: hypothetical protein WCJ37_02700 [Syntrophus sp. (in: bacteria)]